jgi:hypothetical protein
MEPKGSLLYSRVLASCPYPDSDKSNLHLSIHLSKIHFIMNVLILALEETAVSQSVVS